MQMLKYRRQVQLGVLHKSATNGYFHYGFNVQIIFLIKQMIGLAKPWFNYFFLTFLYNDNQL